MKERELRTHARCDMCKSKIGESIIPLFWVVKIERHGIDLKVTRRQQGFGMMIGAELAMVMGPDEEMTIPMMEPLILTVCETCGVESTQCITSMAEIKGES